MAVQIEIEDGVGILTLNEPNSRNALSLELRADLTSAVESVLNDSQVRSILFTANGPAFCAGGDLRLVTGTTMAVTGERMGAIHRLLVRLLSSDTPIVTAVGGVAAGAGFSLALTGDIVCAAETATFKPSFLGVGAVPDLGLSYTLPRAVGAVVAKDILLMNREIAAPEAYQLGFVSRLFPADRLFSESLAIARTLAQGPSPSIAFTKRLLNKAFDLPLEAVLDFERLAQSIAYDSLDFKEGVAAFRERRRPTFGRPKQTEK
jgi:2-(1,2-epoxy-1,2-dihydrophenyl)acetyl-CoA isomerase